MKKFHFSFGELCLVSAVFLMGAALLIPVLHAAQEQDHTVGCADQSRRLGAAFAAFAQGNDGYLPRTQLGADEKADGNWVLWTFDLYRKGYIKTSDLICPDGMEMLGDNWAKGKIRTLLRAKKNCDAFAYSFYGYNAMGAGGSLSGEKPVKLAALSRIILTTDSWDGNNYKIARYIGSSVVMDRYIANRGLVNPLHDGKATVLWSDGSVSAENGGGEFPHEAWKSGVFSVKSNWRSTR